MESDEREVVLYPRAQRDLVRMEKRYARQICADLPLLRTPPWPRGKVKRLHGCPFWEMKTGDFRAVFLPEGKSVIILRIVDRKGLDLAISGIDRRAVESWLRERE